MNTLRPETTGLPYVCVPSFAIHLTFFPDLTSHSRGIPAPSRTLFRDGECPHCGESLPGGETTGGETTGDGAGFAGGTSSHAIRLTSASLAESESGCAGSRPCRDH